MTDPVRKDNAAVIDMGAEDDGRAALDPVTHRRLRLALDTADALEVLAETGAWSRLDPCARREAVTASQVSNRIPRR